MDLNKLEISEILEKNETVFIATIINDTKLNKDISDIKEYYKNKEFSIGKIKGIIIDVDCYRGNHLINKINVFFKTDLSLDEKFESEKTIKIGT